MSTIRLDHIKKKFGQTEVIKDLSLTIPTNSFTVIVGPSGCGKSTLLRLIAGLEEVDHGSITIDEQDITQMPPSKRGVAMVFQSYALYPHMSVYDNMAFGLKLAKQSRSAIKERVEKTADILQLTSLLQRKPKELSGGQRQRVAIGRAITREPKVFLFDEPLSNLDAALRVEMRLELAKLRDQIQSTMVYVTHDQTEAMTLADQIVVMRNGVIEQIGRPLDLYYHPANMFVAEFIGSPRMNFLNAEVKDINGTKLTLGCQSCDLIYPQLETSHMIGKKVVLGIRPEHIILSDQPKSMRGVVSYIEYLGKETYLYVKLPDQSTLVVKGDPKHLCQKNEVVEMAIDPNLCHLFSLTGESLSKQNLSS